MLLGLGVFASVNGPGLGTDPGYALSTIFYYISDKLIGKQPWVNETTTCEFPEPWRRGPTQANSTPAEPSVKLPNPSEYVGYYGSKFMPGINVTETPGDQSSLSFQMNRLAGILHSTPDTDRFLMEFKSPWEIAPNSDDNNETQKLKSKFQRNDAGEIRSLEVTFDVKLEYVKDGINIPIQAATNSAMTWVIANPVQLFTILMAILIKFVR